MTLHWKGELKTPFRCFAFCLFGLVFLGQHVDKKQKGKYPNFKIMKGDFL